MAKVRSTVIRNFFASVFAVALIVLLAAVAASVFGWDIPILSDIGNAIGL